MYKSKLIIPFLIFILSSCTQTFQKNGLTEKKIENFNIKIGKTSKKFLIDNYGPPIFENVFNDNVIIMFLIAQVIKLLMIVKLINY